MPRPRAQAAPSEWSSRTRPHPDLKTSRRRDRPKRKRPVRDLIRYGRIPKARFRPAQAVFHATPMMENTSVSRSTLRTRTFFAGSRIPRSINSGGEAQPTHAVDAGFGQAIDRGVETQSRKRLVCRIRLKTCCATSCDSLPWALSSISDAPRYLMNAHPRARHWRRPAEPTPTCSTGCFVRSRRPAWSLRKTVGGR